MLNNSADKFYEGYITDINGINVGHYTDCENGTGCTAIVIPEGAVCGCDVRGCASGTRETALTRPDHTVQRAHAVILSGGSAFGLSAAGGAMYELEKAGIGFDVGPTKVPIVLSAVIYDLEYKSAFVRPTEANGAEAVRNATHSERRMGSIGAGTGATVGKLLGMEHSEKSGLGSASVYMPGGVIVSAIVSVNALGDVFDESGKIIRGTSVNGEYIDTEQTLIKNGGLSAKEGGNTTIGVIATNAVLDKAQCGKLASLAHNGYALSIRPIHTAFDGDTIFGLATCEINADINAVYAASQVAMRRAILNAARAAINEENRT